MHATIGTVSRSDESQSDDMRWMIKDRQENIEKYNKFERSSQRLMLIILTACYNILEWMTFSSNKEMFNPRTCKGVERTPHGFSQITRVKRGGSPRNLQYPRVDQFDTYCENFKSMSCQVIKLWRHMSGHVRTKSADFAICRTMVRVLASQRMSMHSMRVYWCLWMSRHHIQLTQGQGHARSRFIGASSRSI